VTLSLDHYILLIQRVVKRGGQGKIKGGAGSVLKPFPSMTAEKERHGDWCIWLVLCLLDLFLLFGSINRPEIREASNLTQNLNLSSPNKEETRLISLQAIRQVN
jgi:hypothetical protein